MKGAAIPLVTGLQHSGSDYRQRKVGGAYFLVHRGTQTMIERMNRRRSDRSVEVDGELRGIVIAMGETGTAKKSGDAPRFWGFVYGEFLPQTPTLPFGRWKKAS